MNDKDLIYFFTLIYSKIFQYNKKDFGSFFLNDSDDFVFVSSLVFFLLLKERLINKDKSEAGKLFSNMNVNDIDIIFKNNNINIDSVDSVKLLNNIRNAILHGCFDIDLNDRVVHINDTSKNFSIDLPFNFFKDFAGRNLSEITYIENQKEFSIDIAFFDIKNIYSNLYLNGICYDDNIESINNYDTFKYYMSLFESYKIVVHSKDGENINTNDVEVYGDDELLNYSDIYFFSKEVNRIASEIYPDISKQIMRELIKINQPNNLTNRIKIFEYLFIDALNKQLCLKYPNLEFNIVRQSLSEEIINYIYYKKIRDHDEFFENPFFVQKNEIQSSLNQFLEYGETRLLLSSLNDLIGSFDIVKKTFSSVENNIDLEILLYVINNSSNIFEFIHEVRKKYNLNDEDTYYDSCVYYDINIEPNFTEDEYSILKYHVDRNLGRMTLNDLKNINYEIYLKYHDYFKSKDSISDQDVKYYHDRSICISNMYMVRNNLYKYRSIMSVSLIYLLLTGLFAPNVENSIFNNSSFVSELCKKIPCYSSSYYNMNISVVENIKKKILNKKSVIENLKKQYSQCNDSLGQERLSFKIKQLETEIDEYYLRINDDILDIDGIKFQRTNEVETLSRLRNVFSHLERVKIIDLENGEIELTDFNNGKQVAIIRVNIKDILDLFSMYSKNIDIENKQLV